jgi:hypothetical protein
MRNAFLARAVFWLGMAGLLWLVIRAILIPLRITT